MKRHLLPYYTFIHARVAEVSQSKKKNSGVRSDISPNGISFLAGYAERSCDGSAVSMCVCVA